MLTFKGCRVTFVLVLSCTMLSACLSQKSNFLDLNHIREIAKNGGGAIPLSEVMQADVTTICEFWPYSEVASFEDHPMQPHFDGMDIFPIDEGSWWIVFFDKTMVRVGEEKYPRTPSRLFSQRLFFADTDQDLNTRNNCKTVSETVLEISESGQLNIR